MLERLYKSREEVKTMLNPMKFATEKALAQKAVEAIDQLTGNIGKDIPTNIRLRALGKTAQDYVKNGKISFLFFARCFCRVDGKPYYQVPDHIKNLREMASRKWLG